MSETLVTEPRASGVSRRPAPTRFWIIAALSLLWNAGGALDYTMTQLQNAEYMSTFTPEQIAYFTSFPAWFDAVWALGVWGAIAGSVLLLLRSRFAIAAFGVSLFGLVVTTIATVMLGQPDSLNTVGNWLFTAAIWVITILLFRFAQRAYGRGIIA